MMSQQEISKLIQDEIFLSYCFQKDAEAVKYWEEKLKANPEDSKNIQELKTFITLMAHETGAQEVEVQKHALQKRIENSKDQNKKSLKIWNWTAAAAVLLILSVGIGYLSVQHLKTVSTGKLLSAIKPGGNTAILRLANGKEIALAQLKNGTTLKQQNLTITKTKDGMLTYSINPQPGSNTGNQEFNTIITPKGGTYKISLPDGTNVWLNAKSELKYPISFTGSERKVELQGEAYFEVKHLKDKPFLVKSIQQTIEVLGTHFNVNTYADEPVFRTTLLEGSVKVTALNHPASSRILSPGQTAILDPKNAVLDVQETNTQLAVAWKNGLFYFKDADLNVILRTFSRWYNIDIVTEGNLSGRKFSGKLYRNVNAYQALDVLRLLGIEFSIETDKNQQPVKIIVKP